jgi:hypothetical protein
MIGRMIALLTTYLQPMTALVRTCRRCHTSPNFRMAYNPPGTGIGFQCFCVQARPQTDALGGRLRSVRDPAALIYISSVGRPWCSVGTFVETGRVYWCWKRSSAIRLRIALYELQIIMELTAPNACSRRICSNSSTFDLLSIDPPDSADQKAFRWGQLSLAGGSRSE